MKKQIILAALWLMSGLAFAQPLTRQEKFILDLSRAKFGWLVDKQYDSLIVLMDDRVQYIHSNGWTQNKMEVIEDLRSGKIIYDKVTIKESGVRFYNSTAIVTGMGTFEGVNSDNPFTLELRYTEVYIKIGNRWRLASRHANRMP